jgi:hypothetical protein
MSVDPARLGGATALMRQLSSAPCPTWWEMAESRLLIGGNTVGLESVSRTALVFCVGNRIVKVLHGVLA